jgi:hypothetical protein
MMPGMSRNQIKTACVLMTGPDVQMDQRGDSYEPANTLPTKCPHCTFPDLDFVANPYVLTKGVSSPAETSPAQLGNFLVRERARRILEIAVPEACTFHPTVERKTKKAAPWWLAVPKHTLATPVPKQTAPFCSKCNEPKVWHSVTREVRDRMKHFDSKGIDIFKTREWDGGTVEDQFEATNAYREKSGMQPLPWSNWDVSPPPHTERWTRMMLCRDLYFSIRLEQLLKRARIKGQLVRLLDFKDMKPSPEDETWIEEKLKLLVEHGLTEQQGLTERKTGSATQKWFRQFLQRNAKKRPLQYDIAAIETRQNLGLPKDYKDFISAIGPMSFEGVMETEGFTARVLPPPRLDFKNYRQGRVPDLDEEQSQIDGVLFAETEHGDAFVFDVSAKGDDYPVFWHDHEQNTLEPFAPNFAECIKRFSQKN